MHEMLLIRDVKTQKYFDPKTVSEVAFVQLFKLLEVSRLLKANCIISIWYFQG